MQAPAALSDPPAPTAIHITKHIYQRVTYRNAPMLRLFIMEQPVATTEGDTSSTEGATLAGKEGDVGDNHFVTKQTRARTPKGKTINTTRVINDGKVEANAALQKA